MVATATKPNQAPILEVTEIRPQPRQEEFLRSSADIAIIGGAAFGGKTYAMLMEPLRHMENKEFGAVIFRRTIAEITREGGLWDEAGKLYPALGAESNQQEHSYKFPSGAKVTFSHLQHEKDKESWKSAQVVLIEFDQLETFTESQFFYMFSRNRSATSGIRPYIRATANPQPGWLAEFLKWWIDDDGWAIPERSGKIRWMVRESGQIYWSDSREDLQEQHPKSTPKSVTFILSTIYDNQIGMKNDPGYIGNLQALDLVDRERLLGDRDRGGNWKIAPEAGKVFNRDWFKTIVEPHEVPIGGTVVLRRWDLAATEDKLADFTASCRGKIVDGKFYILDATADQIDPSSTDSKMLAYAGQDGKAVGIRWEEEGGASGKRDTYHIVTRILAGYDARGIRSRGDKITVAKPLAAQALAGNVVLVRGDWNERWLKHMHMQDGKDTTHDDEMDAASNLYQDLLDEGSGWSR